MAEEERDIKVMQVAWSAQHLPLFELAVKFPLPFLAKSASTSSGSRIGAGGRILAGEIYRMQRLVRVQKVVVQVNEDSLSTDLRSLPGMDKMEISIPKDYHGLFRILPSCSSMRATYIKDVMKTMPRHIKVLTSIRRKPTEVQLEAGEILEVLGTTMRLTKTGVVEFLRLQKKHREFVLHPDFEGNFEIPEDTTHYTLAEILERFPMPQQVCLANLEQHSEMLLNKLPARGQNEEQVKLTLKREYQKEYVIGVDMYGRVGVVVDMDADVQFYLPDTTCRHGNTNENDIIHRILTKSTQTNGELRTDQVICHKEEKLVLCKPWQQLFKDLPPVLPFRRRSGEPGEMSPLSLSSAGSNIADDTTTTTSDDSHPRHVAYDSVTDSDSGHDTLDEEPIILSSTRQIYEGFHNAMDRNTTLPVNDPGHDRRSTLQKRRNKIITSPNYVNINISPITPEKKPHHIPIPSPERTPRSLYDDQSFITSPTSEHYTAFSTSLPNRTFIDDHHEDVMYQNSVPKTTKKVNQKSVKDIDGIRPPSHFKPKPHPRKSSFRRTSENGDDPREVWQRRQTENSESRPPMRLPSSPTTPPAFKEMNTSLHDSVFDESQTSLKTKTDVAPSRPTTLPLPDICHETSQEIVQDETQQMLPRYRQNLKRLTVDEVIDVLKALKINTEAQQLFRDNDVDGVLFSCLDEKILEDEFELSRFHSLKIAKFIRGWRPVTTV